MVETRDSGASPSPLLPHSPSVLSVAAVQPDIAWEDKEANFARVQTMLDSAGPLEGALVVLPEMFATGFSMNVSAIAEEAAPSPRAEARAEADAVRSLDSRLSTLDSAFPSHDSRLTTLDSAPTQHFLSNQAHSRRAYVLGGVVTRGPDGKGRNESLVYSPDGTELSRYQKMYPFTLGGESANYTAGPGPVLFRCGPFTVAQFVCYDLRFPEAFRAAVRRGAQLFTVIASWPEARISHWVTLLQARAIENQAYVIGVNRVGTDPTLRYTGRSLIVAPGGEILADAGERESVIRAELDAQTLQDYRCRLPFLEDMREDI